MNTRSCLFLLIACTLALSACSGSSSPEAAPLPAAKPGKESSLRLTLLPHAQVAPGKPTPMEAKITRIKDRLLIRQMDLLPASLPLTLIAIDSNFESAQTITPEATPINGLYRFNLTPASQQAYRIWADIALTDGKTREFPYTDVGGKRGTHFPREEKLTATVSGATYQLTLSEPAEKGDETTLTITQGDKPVVMKSLIGVYDDYRTVLRQSGGESVTLKPAREGFLRLFAHVESGGKTLMLPFTLKVVK